MALATYNATLEYAGNTIQFWYTDDAGGEVDFHPNTKFHISRIDDPEVTYVANPIVNAGGTIMFNIEPPAYLQQDGDTVVDYDNPVYEHLYSMKADGVQVYIYGKLNLVEIA